MLKSSRGNEPSACLSANAVAAALFA